MKLIKSNIVGKKLYKIDIDRVYIDKTLLNEMQKNIFTITDSIPKVFKFAKNADNFSSSTTELLDLDVNEFKQVNELLGKVGRGIDLEEINTIGGI